MTTTASSPPALADLPLEDLQIEIEAGWVVRDQLSPATHGPIRTAVDEALRRLDGGEARVAEKVDGLWIVRQ